MMRFDFSSKHGEQQQTAALSDWLILMFQDEREGKEQLFRFSRLGGECAGTVEKAQQQINLITAHAPDSQLHMKIS